MNASPENRRSTFVSVVAWIFIVLAGMNTMVGILQNVMVQLMFSGDAFDRATQQAISDPQVPMIAVWIMRHFQLMVFLILVLSAATLAASIGLLRRREWARRLFIGMMLLGIAYQLGGLLIPFFMMDSFTAGMHGAPPDVAGKMQGFFIGMMVIAGLMAVAIAGVFGWIAKRLMEPGIRSEFE